MKPLPLLITVALLGSSGLLGEEEKPKVKKQTMRPAIFADGGVPRPLATGTWNPKWSKYSAYLQLMVDRVQLEFEKSCNETAKMPQPACALM